MAENHPTIEPPIVVPGAPGTASDDRVSEDQWLEQNAAEVEAPAKTNDPDAGPDAPSGTGPVVGDDPKDGDAQTAQPDQTTGDEERVAEPADAKPAPVVSTRERLQYAQVLRQDGWSEARIQNFFKTADEEAIEWVANKAESMTRAAPDAKQEAESLPPIGDRIAPIVEKLKAQYGEEMAGPIGEIAGAFQQEIGTFQGALQSVVGIVQREMQNLAARNDALEWQIHSKELSGQFPVLADPKRSQAIQDIARDLVKAGSAKGMDMPQLIKRAAAVYVSELPATERAKLEADSHRRRSLGTPTRTSVQGKTQAGGEKLSREEEWAKANGLI